MGKHRDPVFDYVTEVDPNMSSFGWSVIGLTYLAVALPQIGALFPREAATKWSWVIVAETGAIVIALVNVWHYRRMTASDGFVEPPPFAVLTEIVLGTVFAGMLAYGLSGAAGIYRPLVFVPALLLAMIGNRAMIVVAWSVATVTVTWLAVASDSVDSATVAFVISYGATWGMILAMVHVVALASLNSDRQTRGLADAAEVAARTNSLVDGLDELLPVLRQWSGASVAAAYRVTLPDIDEAVSDPSREDSQPVLLCVQPRGTAPTPPRTGEILRARDERGVDLSDRRVTILAAGETDEALAIVLDDLHWAKATRMTIRFNMERMAVQVGVLVNRSRHIARLEGLGLTDGLTGLPNRRALEAELDRVMTGVRRSDDRFVLAIIDLDQFKGFNDTFGHLAGDDLLRSFAKGLKQRLRVGDFIGRYGGEEFCLLLHGLDAKDAEGLIDDLREKIADIDGLAVTFSAGIALWDGDETADELVGRADAAMYDAKRAGRSCTRLAATGDQPRPFAVDGEPDQPPTRAD